MYQPKITRPDPAAVADLLTGIAETQASDRQIAAILDQAAAALRALGWNRYATRLTDRSARAALKRRHQARAGGVARA